MTTTGRRNPTGPVGATAALLVAVSVIISAFIGWVIAGTISAAVGIAVVLCALLLVSGVIVLSRIGVLTVSVRLPQWMQRLDETAPVDMPWSDAVQRAVNLGGEEAVHFHQERIGPEHLLLGVVRENGHATRALASLGITLEQLIRSVDFVSGVGKALQESKPPLDGPSRHALDAAAALARAARARMISTDHLLLALASEEHGTAAAILDSLGCTPVTLTRALRETR